MCFDSESVFGIWCGQYTCKLRRAANEHPYCYNGYDRDVLAQLPKNICAEFPALLTHRSAISISLVKDTVSSVMRKMNFGAFQKTSKPSACGTAPPAVEIVDGGTKEKLRALVCGRKLASLRLNLVWFAAEGFLVCG